MQTAADKMLWAFVGENIKTWEDFLKVRAEVVSYLYPIQAIRDAKVMAQKLKSDLDNYYKEV